VSVRRLNDFRIVAQSTDVIITETQNHAQVSDVKYTYKLTLI